VQRPLRRFLVGPHVVRPRTQSNCGHSLTSGTLANSARGSASP